MARSSPPGLPKAWRKLEAAVGAGGRGGGVKATFRIETAERGSPKLLEPAPH
jgi:hypothetical protein